MATSAEVPWFKSSYSGGSGTECIEAAFVASGVLVRDSKQPGHAHLTVSAEAWTGFVAGARHTQFAGRHRPTA
ncbi:MULTISPECIES: DUF397 domain-containing protein [unclassified Streptomyces]|uniref:DUF397 domain-containing protein n=1 Tax=unclassified Streptomyces TaxID=2593676 RepID=UPI000C27B92D|nr:DUF397 domain-containing protein [Streptomyces sp. CB01373]PJM94800.1 DUF397 domain-containing protein [Streptomyces sp. CB01373]